MASPSNRQLAENMNVSLPAYPTEHLLLLKG